MKDFLTENGVVLFQGDSITDCDRGRADDSNLGMGYPAKIAEIWRKKFPKPGLTFLNRGVSGDRTGNLLERYDRDFIAPKPDLVSILIGVNDTWRRYDSNDPTTTEQYEKNYRTLLQNLKRDLPQAGIVIIEPFLLCSDPVKAVWREDLDPKIQAARRLAREFADVFIPMDGIFVRYAVEGLKDTDMSADGVHPSALGHEIIAKEWLKALGKDFLPLS